MFEVTSFWGVELAADVDSVELGLNKDGYEDTVLFVLLLEGRGPPRDVFGVVLV